MKQTGNFQVSQRQYLAYQADLVENKRLPIPGRSPLLLKVAVHSFRPMGISIVKDPKMTHFDAVKIIVGCTSQTRKMDMFELKVHATKYLKTKKFCLRIGS